MTRLLFILLLLGSSLARAEEFTLATLEWPPYTCESCWEQGASIAVLKKVIQDAGHTVRFIFYPWPRCVKEAEKGKVEGCWPVWPSDIAGTKLVSSTVLFYSPLGVAERIDHPLKIRTLKDLKNVRLGVVQDYGYTPEYLSLLHKGVLKPQIVRTDIQNIEKLAAGRIDATLIDALNFKFLTEIRLPHLTTVLHINPKTLSYNTLAIGLNQQHSNKLNKILQRGIEKHPHLQKELETAIKKVFEEELKKRPQPKK